jgi:hypothetical protein
MQVMISVIITEKNFLIKKIVLKKLFMSNKFSPLTGNCSLKSRASNVLSPDVFTPLIPNA